MAITSQPANPLKNRPPMVLTEGGFTDPYALVSIAAGQPQEIYDRIVNHAKELMQDDWLGFLDAFSMTKSFETDYVEFLETTTRDQVIDDAGAVTRLGNVFTIIPANITGFTAGEDVFHYQLNDNIYVVDTNGLMEQGVITVLDKAGLNFTAVCANGAAWSGLLVNLTLDTMGSDFDRGSCGPEGTLETRKTTSRFLKLNIVKKAMQSTGGKRYAFCIDGEWKWYDENKLRIRKILNKEVAKKLLISIQSADGSAAHTAGKYGTMGLFSNIETYGVTWTGAFNDIAHFRALADYWDSLGMSQKEFVFKGTKAQIRDLEAIAKTVYSELSVVVNVDARHAEDNYARFGYKSFSDSGYTIHFQPWGLTDGNSPFGKTSTIDAMPNGIFIPMGTTTTKINGGEEQQTPYIFKAYQNMAKSPGMVRQFLTGAYAPTPTNDCEYEKITLSTTVGLIVVVPEVFVILKEA